MTTIGRRPMDIGGPQLPAKSGAHTGLITAVLCALFLAWFLSTGVSALQAAVCLTGFGLVLVFLRPTAAAISTLIYLTIMGDVRRYISMHNGILSQDPMLLVSPLISGFLFLRLAFERKLIPNTPIAKNIVVLMVIMTIQIVNPIQGGLMVGIGGAMYYLVPMMWFWIGRGYETEHAQRDMLRLIIPVIAAAASVVGIYQVYWGWLPWEKRWIEESLQGGFSSLVVEGQKARPFAFFTSPGEFAIFVSMGIVCCAAPLLARRFRWTALLIPLMGAMEFLASVRTTIVLCALGISSVWVLLGRTTDKMLVRAVLLGVVALPAALFGLRHLGEDDGAASALTKHMVEGLLHPEESSAGGHAELLALGVWQGIKNPIGEGLGSTTMSASKLGGAGHGGSFEYDVPDMFAALGVVGGITFVVLICRVFVTALGLWTGRGSLMALTMIAVLISQLGFWLVGGHYAASALVFFLIGSMDRTVIPAAPPPRPLAPVRRATDATPASGAV